MILSAFFTLWMLLAAPSSEAQSGPEPDQDETPAEHSGAVDPDIESRSDNIELPPHPIESAPDDPDPSGAAPNASAPAPELRERPDDDEPAGSDSSLELELTSGAGTRGELAAESLLRAGHGRLSAALGIGSGGGPQAAQRQWLRAQLSLEALATWSLAGLWQPAQAGTGQEQLLVSAEGDGARGSWQATVLQQDAWLSAAAAGLRGASSTAMEFSGVSASLDGSLLLHDSDERQGLRATARLGAGAFALAVPKSAAGPWISIPPWERLGQRALAWPARAEGALGLSLSGSAGTASLSLGVGLPAQAGSAEGELALAGEHGVGRATLALQLSLARLWPSGLWLGGVTCAAKWRFLSG